MNIFISTQAPGLAMLLIFGAFLLLYPVGSLAEPNRKSPAKGCRAMAVVFGLIGVFLLTWQI